MNKANDISAIAMRARSFVQAESKSFQECFGVPLERFFKVRSRAGLIIGFDITAFDKAVIKSGKRAMSSVIKEKYGECALLQIERLYHWRPFVDPPHAAPTRSKTSSQRQDNQQEKSQ